MSSRPPVFTAERLLQILQAFPVVKEYVVGFSGGADSTALLHALNTIRDQLGAPISAVHINHGLHDHADTWQSECQAFCLEHSIKLVCLTINLTQRSGKGLEAQARQLRYQAISTLIEPGSCLLTAHHADDQAETLLLNLMRGSGVDGLSAMPDSRPLGKGTLQRPLLGFQSTALRNYLAKNGIEWSEDPSNRYMDHDRNFVRHKIMPLLEARWPAVSKRLLLTRQAMTGARHLLEKMADSVLDQSLAHPFVLSVTPRLDEDPELFKLVIRRWIKRAEMPSIPVYSLESFCNQARQPSRNHNVAVNWEDCSLRLYQQQLWLQAGRRLSPCPSIVWPVTTSRVELGADAGLLTLEGSAPTQPPGGISVGCRSELEGERTRQGISQGAHHKSLKNLFQSAAIPPWLRDCIPLCQLDGELVAMGDWCFSDQFEAWLSENNASLNWYPENTLLKFIHAQLNPKPGNP